MKNKLTIWGLLALSAVLMSIPFLIPHCGFVALFGFVPLLCADKMATDQKVKHFWWYYYLCFLGWNLLSTWWVCNATVGGGLFASFANALQMAVIFALFRLSKKKFSGALPYIFLTVTWIAWERFYFDAEISWPWLTLGNAFARSVGSIQWYEYTGSLGGSLWIWAANLTLFGTMVFLGDGRFFEKWNGKARAAWITWTAVIIACPFIISGIIWHNYKEVEKPLEVLVTQPDIDPYYKFGHLSQAQQDEILFHIVDSTMTGSAEKLSFGVPRHDGIDNVSSTSVLTKRNSGEDDMYVAVNDTLAVSVQDSAMTPVQERPLLIIAPETFNGGLVTNSMKLNRSWDSYHGMLKKYPGANFLFGASAYEYIQSAKAPSYTARKAGDGLWTESHNAGVMMDGNGEGEIFFKTKLVVGTEYMPYPRVLGKLDDKLGGVIGRCTGQDEISCLHYRSNDGKTVIPVGCAVCYESVYGEYCTGYVRKGAQMIAVITNDAWWGDTAGYKQHCSYSSIRAIETRRSIARSANSGISCLINQRGEITESRGWWERTSILGKINLNTRQTFFVQHGDITGRISTFCFILLLLALIVRLITTRRTR